MNPGFLQKRLAILLTVTFTLVSFLMFGQASRRDVIYLKNGSVIKGDILEVIPNETLKVKTSDGSTFVFKMDEVERTGKDEPVKNDAIVVAKEEVKTPQKASPKSSGYLLMLRLGPNVHLFNSSSDFSAGIINGVQLNQYLSLGIGAEATTYVYDEVYNSTIMIFPIFFDARFYIPKQTVQPMFSMQIGYGIAGNKNSRRDSGVGPNDFEPDNGDGGFFYGVSAGLRLQATKRLAVIIDGGLSMQKLSGTRYSSHSTIEESVSLRGNFGVSWNFGAEKN